MAAMPYFGPENEESARASLGEARMYAIGSRSAKPGGSNSQRFELGQARGMRVQGNADT